MKPHMVRIVCAAWLALAGSTQAGYRNVPASERVVREVHPAIGAPATWSATLGREDGTAVELQNVGDRFGSVELKPGEHCWLCLRIPGLRKDSVVTLASTHGGKAEGQPKARVSAHADGEICFSYEMGTMGPHPLIVTVMGRSMTLLFNIAPPARPQAGTTPVQETRP